MTKEDGAFVSRHGRRTALNQADLAGILDEPIAISKDQVRRRGHRKLTNHQWLITGAVAVIVVILIPVVVGEILTAEYNSSAKTAKDQMKSLIDKTVLPQQKKATITAQALGDIAAKTEAVRDQTCPGGLFDNMAVLYPRAKHAYNICLQERSKVAQVANNARDIEKEALYMQSLSPLMTPLIQSTNGDFAVIGSQLSNWQNFQSKVANLSPPPTLIAADTALQAAITQVVTGWSDLNTSANAQDSKGFTDSQTLLAKGYQSVRDSTALFDTQLTQTQNALTQSALQL